MRIPGSGLLTGMWVTLRNFRAPKVTLQYPEERPQMPDRWRGRLDLIYNPFGEHKCEVCFQCAQVLPRSRCATRHAGMRRSTPAG